MGIRLRALLLQAVARVKKLGLRLTVSRRASAANFCLMAAAMVSDPDLMPAIVVLGGYLAMRRAHWLGGIPLGTDAEPWRDARAIFLGHERHGWGTAWLSAEDVRSHVTVLGGDHDQRVALSLNLLTNALAWGGGAFLLDTTGHPGLLPGVADLAMRFGRQEDVRIIDLAAQSEAGLPASTRSNSINPFAQANAAQVAAMAFHLAKRRITVAERRRLLGLLLHGLASALCWRRDAAAAVLDPASLCASLDFDALVGMADRKTSTDLPEEVRHDVARYLRGLPGWRYGETAPGPGTMEAHRRLQAAVVAGLAPLTVTYAPVFCPAVPDIDLQDVVEHSRLLVVRLPGEGASPEFTSDMAVLFASMLRVTAGNCLAAGADQTSVSGEAWLSNPHIRHSATSFLCIMNGAEHCVRSTSLLASAARGCDFALAWLSPSLDSIERSAGLGSANDLIASSRTRIFLPGDPAVTGQSQLCPEHAGTTVLGPDEMLVDSPQGVVALRRAALPEVAVGQHSVVPLLLPAWPSAA